MFGFLNINKPAGPTSHDIVAEIRRRLPRKTKVGHAGTLDPFADGVLVICAGPATRLADYVQQGEKRYTAQVTLGAVSTTDDGEGEIQPAGCERQCSQNDIEKILPQFVGDIRQTPPAHSAVHVQGRRAYQLARAGEEVALTPRTVTIHEIQLLHYDWPTLRIDVRCGSGTYIRALARDIGRALKVGGYCSSLTRTAVGPFTLDQAVRLDDIDPNQNLLPPTTGLTLPTLQLNEDQIAHLRHGRRMSIDETTPLPQSPEIALLDKENQLLAIARAEEQHIQPTKVFFH
ncbi:MAG: tRNA pseudouridine(55) synthase TruB [Phycisphaerae bacterium]|nr:tRNA pseudouridine(55) synthase TruB [Phycisphaerae bacterium]